jgi:hypothetical protein
MAVAVVTMAHTEAFRAGMIVKIANRKLIVTRVIPRVGLKLKPARWYHFLLYNVAHCMAKRRREHE